MSAFGVKGVEQPSGEPLMARVGALNVSIKDKAGLYAAYMRFILGGALFIPTTRVTRLGDTLQIVLHIVEENLHLSIPGKVCWITPSGVPGRPQGVGVQFDRDGAGQDARSRIEQLIGAALRSNRPTHTI